MIKGLFTFANNDRLINQLVIVKPSCSPRWIIDVLTILFFYSLRILHHIIGGYVWCHHYVNTLNDLFGNYCGGFLYTPNPDGTNYSN